MPPRPTKRVFAARPSSGSWTTQLNGKQWTALFALATLLVGWLLLLTACQTTGSAVTRPTAACRAFKPIRWSVTDSIPTQQQAIEHNAAWKALCEASDRGR